MEELKNSLKFIDKFELIDQITNVSDIHRIIEVLDGKLLPELEELSRRVDKELADSKPYQTEKKSKKSSHLRDAEDEEVHSDVESEDYNVFEDEDWEDVSSDESVLYKPAGFVANLLNKK